MATGSHREILVSVICEGRRSNQAATMSGHHASRRGHVVWRLRLLAAVRWMECQVGGIHTACATMLVGQLIIRFTVLSPVAAAN